MLETSTEIREEFCKIIKLLLIAFYLFYSLVTAGVTARQLLVKSGSDKNEAFRMKKLIDANNFSNSNSNNTLMVIAQDTRKNENLARYSISLVLLHVEEWKNYWSSKNIRGFMSFYHKNFPDKKNFEDNKRRIFQQRTIYRN